MATWVVQTRRRRVVASRVAAGVLGGLVGGLVFGVMMNADGLMPVIAMLAVSESPAVGWLLHFGISVFIGGTFGLLAGRWLTRPVAVAAGLVWGAVWWIFGALFLMPARLGMPTFRINEMTIRSLVGHLAFGALLGTVAWRPTPRSRPSAGPHRCAGCPPANSS